MVEDSLAKDRKLSRRDCWEDSGIALMRGFFLGGLSRGPKLHEAPAVLRTRCTGISAFDEVLLLREGKEKRWGDTRLDTVRAGETGPAVSCGT